MQSREIEDVETYFFFFSFLFSFFFKRTHINSELSIRTHKEIDPTLEAQRC